jgi:hypothetical protein
LLSQKTAPTAASFVHKIDFKYLEDMVNYNSSRIEQISGTLMSGLSTEFDHLIKSRPTRTEVEDMLNFKFDKVSGDSLG